VRWMLASSRSRREHRGLLISFWAGEAGTRADFDPRDEKCSQCPPALDHDPARMQAETGLSILTSALEKFLKQGSYTF
jgi:hypothetical protein